MCVPCTVTESIHDLTTLTTLYVVRYAVCSTHFKEINGALTGFKQPKQYLPAALPLFDTSHGAT